MELPGRTGWNLLGDKTIEFARFPLDFINDRIKKYSSRLFLSRVLNKPTVFVTSNQGVKEMLYDKSSSFQMGYKDFGYMHDLYGDLALFEDDETASRVCKIMKELFQHQQCRYYMAQVERITEEKFQDIDTGAPVDVYEVLKDLSTRIFLSIFLDVNSEAEYQEIKQLATSHWHGLISFPASIKVKGWASGYSRAEVAKSELLQIIYNKLGGTQQKGRFLQIACDAGFQNEEEAAIHLLLFISAVIPKAFSSLLTSFIYELAGEEKKALRNRLMVDESIQDDILLEVQRMWPPFFGGRRHATEDVIIDGYHIPSGYSVAYISRFANRDSLVFNQSEHFLPERWQSFDKDKRHLVSTFGGGARCCVGITLIEYVNKYVTKYLSSKFDWVLSGNANILFKTLPVARPKEPLLTIFTRINNENEAL